jgi:carbon-monoxide dehydrogenase medium subunit
MKPAPFAYHAPTTISEAVALLGEGRDCKVLAGGQSLVPVLALRLSRFDALVDLRRIDDLKACAVDDGELVVGAMCRQADLERNPMVAEHAPLVARATPLIGHFQIRNRGTIGGSIAHADPAAEYPAVALALEARVDVEGPNGSRTVPATEFFVSTFTTVVEPDEVVTAVRFPKHRPGTGVAIEEVARRHGDFAVAGVACSIGVSPSGTVTGAAIAVFGVAPTPLRADASERALLGAQAPLGAEQLTEIGGLVARGLDPPDDVHGSARYRRAVVGTLAGRAVGRAVREACDAAGALESPA